MLFSYDDAQRDRAWLYLSALGRVNVSPVETLTTTRNPPQCSVPNSPLKTPIQANWKSEINVLEETTESGREVWKIELIPNAERARKSRYSEPLITW